MKYINTSKELTREFKRLMKQYNHYDWMVAWAGREFELITLLEDNRHKINKIVVGLHFYQTHPNFIQKFMREVGVKFVKSTSGIFHSKVYLFSNSATNWELLIGSSNFTNPAFSENNEACLLISSTEAKSEIYHSALASISTLWEGLVRFSEDELKVYREFYLKQSKKRDSLCGHIKSTNQNLSPNKGFYSVPVVRMTWREYMGRINALNQDIHRRLDLLDYAKESFTRYPIYSDMPDTIRKQIGGYVFSNQPHDFRMFGDMRHATTFKTVNNRNPEAISKALGKIPASGPVEEFHFNAFMENFNLAVNGGDKYKPATRLLALKRPDVFIPLSGPNQRRLATDFDIPSTTFKLNNYWERVIILIQESLWWQDPQPENETEHRIARYRAAFLDAIYYDPTQHNIMDR